MAIHDSYYTKRFRELAGFHRINETSLQVDFIEKTLSLPGGAKVLDMGCGFGRHSISLAQKEYAVTGYDASADYLDEARRAAQGAGLRTWVSMEPVIDPAQGLVACRLLAGNVDLIKLGKINHDMALSDVVEWPAFTEAAIAIFRAAGQAYYRGSL